MAILEVLLVHLPFSRSGLEGAANVEVYPSGAISRALGHSHYGVQLFLVLSGYCIHNQWARRRDTSERIAFGTFFRRRLTRIYPPYLVMLLVSVALTLTAARLFPGSVPRIVPERLATDLVVLLVLLQNFSDAGRHVGNSPLWSLAREVHSYLLYVPLLAMRRAKGWAATLTVTLLVTLTWIVVGKLISPPLQPFWFRAAPACWFAWALGALAAEHRWGMVELPAFTRSFWSFAALVAVGACLKAPLQSLVITVAFFFLLQAVVDREQRDKLRGAWTKPLLSLGRASYGIFLTHDLSYVVAKRLLLTAGVPDQLTLLGRAVAGLAGGYLLDHLVVAPFARLARRGAPSDRRAAETPTSFASSADRGVAQSSA